MNGASWTPLNLNPLLLDERMELTCENSWQSARVKETPTLRGFPPRCRAVSFQGQPPVCWGARALLCPPRHTERGSDSMGGAGRERKAEIKEIREEDRKERREKGGRMEGRRREEGIR